MPPSACRHRRKNAIPGQHAQVGFARRGHRGTSIPQPGTAHGEASARPFPPPRRPPATAGMPRFASATDPAPDAQTATPALARSRRSRDCRCRDSSPPEALRPSAARGAPAQHGSIRPHRRQSPGQWSSRSPVAVPGSACRRPRGSARARPAGRGAVVPGRRRRAGSALDAPHRDRGAATDRCGGDRSRRWAAAPACRHAA